MALGVKETNNDLGNHTYLTVAGGFIWDKKADESDPNYATQDWVNSDGETKVRKGARYKDGIMGEVYKIDFTEHDEWGEFMQTYIKTTDGNFVLSLKMNARDSQSLMKCLFLVGTEGDLFLKPFDFEAKDSGKRLRGVSFKKDGVKVDLKAYEPPTEWSYDSYKIAALKGKKQSKRWLEDYNDFLRSEVEEKIIPKLDSRNAETQNEQKAHDNPADIKVDAETVVLEKEPAKITPLKMKKFLKEYISENYEGQELPTLTKNEVIEWYDLAQKWKNCLSKMRLKQRLMKMTFKRNLTCWLVYKIN